MGLVDETRHLLRALEDAGACYQSAWKTRERIPLSGLSISVLSGEGLLQMKPVASRTKDLMDVENLRSLDR